MQLYPTDLNNIIKTQPLTDEHIVLLVYQLLRGLKVTMATIVCSWERGGILSCGGRTLKCCLSSVYLGYFETVFSAIPFEEHFFRVKKWHTRVLLSQKTFSKNLWNFGNWYFVKEVFFLGFYSIVKLLGAGKFILWRRYLSVLPYFKANVDLILVWSFPILLLHSTAPGEDWHAWNFILQFPGRFTFFFGVWKASERK